MITERIGDLLEEGDLTHIAHQANLLHIFGAGLARQIALRYPYAAAADRATKHGDLTRLGTYSKGYSPGCEGPTVVNLYSQKYPGSGVMTDYKALRAALTSLERELRPHRGARLGLPFRLGCGLAGGSWPKVYGIVEDVFGQSPVAVVVVRRPEDA